MIIPANQVACFFCLAVVFGLWFFGGVFLFACLLILLTNVDIIDFYAIASRMQFPKLCVCACTPM